MSQTSVEKMSQFRAKYNITETFEEMDLSTRKFKYLDNFLFEKDSKNSLKKEFAKGLLFMLDGYIDGLLMPGVNGKAYNTDAFDIKEFIREFEDAMVTKHQETNPNVERKKYAGNGIKMLDTIVERLNFHNKSLYTLWVDRIKTAKFDIPKVRAVTDNIYQNTKDKASLADDKEVETTVMMYKAMEQAYGKRSIGWKLTHWIRWYQEATYLDKLKEQVREFQGKGVNVNAIIERNSRNIVGEETFKAMADVKRVNQEKIENKKIEKELLEKNSVVGKVKTIVASPDFKKNFVDGLVSSLPETSTSQNMQKALLLSSFDVNFVKVIQESNQKFDEQEVKTEEHILAGTKKIFNNAYTMASALGYKEGAQRLAVAQVITDKFMKKLSPATFEMEKYSKFANGYALNNPEEFIKDMPSVAPANGTENMENERQATFEKASQVYNEMTRTKVEVVEIDSVNNNKVVPPVKPAQTHSVPAIDKN